MIDNRKNLWKACVGVLLLTMLLMGYFHYPDYDTAQERGQLLSSKVGSEIEIVTEIFLEDYTICQFRANGGTGCALFREFLGKTAFQHLKTTNSDRTILPIEIGGEPWLILICDQPDVSYAVVHFWNQSTHSYTATEAIDMEGKQILVIPDRPEAGVHGYTEYFDENGNLI